MIFNIGPLEFILIMLVAIIVLGPERMVTGARSFGRWIYKLVRSPTWRAIFSMSQEIRDLPNKIMRESGLEETMKEVQSVGSDLNNEINQTVNDVKEEVSQAAIAVSAEVNQAVKDVNTELKQTAQQASQAAAQATAEANQAIQPPVAFESKPAAEGTPALPVALPDETPQIEASAPGEVGGYDQALDPLVPVEQPELVMQQISVAEPVAISNNGHSQEAVLDAPPQASPAPEASETSEVLQTPDVVKAAKVRKTPKPRKPKGFVPPEDEPSIQPPESPAAHIKLE
jgi:sec-independent protein translocase protein TatB